MYLPSFEYHQPESLEAALQLLDTLGDDAAVLAGGTELLLLMKLGFAEPEHLVSLKRIPGLAGIARDADVVRIGALTVYESVASSAAVQDCAPALARAVSVLANPRVRNSGTLGGSMVFAEPKADAPTLLQALGAKVRIVASDRTERVSSVKDFVLGSYRTTLGEGEILTSIEIPIQRDVEVAYRRVTQGAGRPMLVAAACLGTGPSTYLRVVVGAVTDLPWELTLDVSDYNELEARAAAFVDEIVAQAPVSYSGGRGGEDEDYSRHLIGVTVQRLLSEDLGVNVARI